MEVGESGLEDRTTKMNTIMAAMIIQAAYHGYQPAPTGRAPNRMDTIAIISEYS